MKIRTDFVTNSSSSSYICVGIVNECKELLNYLKNEYGNYGLNLYIKYVKTGRDIDEHTDDFEEFLEYNDVDENEKYLAARFYTYDSEIDLDYYESMFLWEALEKLGYIDKIYESEEY